METQASTQTKFLRLPKVVQVTGISKGSIYNKINPKSKYFDPDFPKRISLGARTIGFYESEVSAWIESRRVIGA